MKKLLFALMVSATLISIQNLDALFGFGRRGRCGRGREAEYQCGPIPCCEKQELITIRKPAEMVCGYVCPPGTEEVGAEPEAVCCPSIARRPAVCC